MGEVFQAKYIAIQAQPKPEHLFAGMLTKALITSNPPLGQVTEVEGGNALFTVLLETDESSDGAIWEVLLWYSQEN